MRAVVFRQPGDPEVLVSHEIDDPVPRADEVVVRVRAAGVNRADVLQRRGRYPAPVGVRGDVPGLECAGTIERIGTSVTEWSPGDRVMALLEGGGYAERVRVHTGAVLPVPPGWSWVDAAAAPEAYLTAFDALALRAGLRDGEQVLVHAAGSGVGLATVQIAQVLGGAVIGLSRNRDRRRRISEATAIEALDPTRPDVASQIVDRTNGGPHVIVDLVGAAAWPLNASVIRSRGRWVIVGLLSGARVEVDLGALVRRRVSVIGTVLRSRSREEKSDLVRRFEDRLFAPLSDGTIRPIVDRVLPLERAADAHRVMEAADHFGKIVLELS